MSAKRRYLIFSDLDGTLLDYATYSYEAALPALGLIEQRQVPLVICSSKTRTEIEYYRERLANPHPFISENGGGIFVPCDYFTFDIGTVVDAPQDGCYRMIALGSPYSSLRAALVSLRAEGFELRGFGDMTADELSQVAGMSIDEAKMAKTREFDEPFVFAGEEKKVSELLRSIAAKGFYSTQGRFFHIIGDSDKGKAVAILADLYRRQLGDLVTVALGDSPNDIPMLKTADLSFAVRKKNGAYDPEIVSGVPDVVRADGIGPEGWNKAVLDLLLQDSTS